MLSRVVTSPWTRTGLLATFLACCGYGLYAAWPQAMVRSASWGWLIRPATRTGTRTRALILAECGAT